MAGRGSFLHYLRLGARVSVAECVLIYLLPFAMIQCSTLAECFWTNALSQLALFLPVVQLPALMTGRMSYVDIGWPCGLVLLGANGLRLGTGFWLRRFVVCGFLLLHGGRMALGALAMFFPYTFPEDLPRYRYARVRWEEKDGMPASGWWLKVQHDTLQQAFANATLLAAPILLCAFDERPSIHALEVVGWAIWGLSWLWENVADMQKLRFVDDCARATRAQPERKLEFQGAVLGLAPFDGPNYCLWTLCRHPNYFGEWMCWNGFVIASIPSLLALEEAGHVKLGLGLALFFCSRIFYDCLAFWTGAEPSEHFSVQKRPKYRDYQSKVRMFFPFEVSGVDHLREAGWPSGDRLAPHGS